MTKNFSQAADIWTDEDFLAWYYKESLEKVSAWEQWMAANPLKQALVQEAHEHMKQLSKNEKPVSSETIETQLKQVHARINSGKVRNIPGRNRQTKWWIAAAAVLIFAIGGIAFWKNDTSAPVLASDYGQVIDNHLPDGSTMILNANSTAKLSPNWQGGNDREVWLKGEAYFKVTKTAQKSRFI